MSPAEITQQLGLQSLTRRAWVSGIPIEIVDYPLTVPLVHPIHLCHHWRRSLRGPGVARRCAPESQPRVRVYNAISKGR